MVRFLIDKCTHMKYYLLYTKHVNFVSDIRIQDNHVFRQTEIYERYYRQHAHFMPQKHDTCAYNDC